MWQLTFSVLIKKYLAKYSNTQVLALAKIFLLHNVYPLCIQLGKYLLVKFSPKEATSEIAWRKISAIQYLYIFFLHADFELGFDDTEISVVEGETVFLNVSFKDNFTLTNLKDSLSLFIRTREMQLVSITHTLTVRPK